MAADRADPALDALLLPFAHGLLRWPQAGDALFLRARTGAALHEAARPGLICEQTLRGPADALRAAGLTVHAPEQASHSLLQHAPPAPTDHPRFALVLLLPPRQREEARALLARAVAQCAPGGTVIACIANDEGAKAGEADLARLCGIDGALQKFHCRVFWSQPTPARTDAALVSAWREADAPRRVAATGLVSRPGVFAWDRIDPASRLLIDHLPGDLSGRAADLGAGLGVLSLALLQRCPRVTAVDLYEAEARALDCARANLTALRSPASLPAAAGGVPTSDAASPGSGVALRYLWHDVTAGLAARYDTIVTNPPFHAQGSAERPDIGRRFIATAAAALAPGGRLWLVANRHLPYEDALDAGFGSVRLVAQRDGFKIVEAVRDVRVAASRRRGPHAGSERLRR